MYLLFCCREKRLCHDKQCIDTPCSDVRTTPENGGANDVVVCEINWLFLGQVYLLTVNGTNSFGSSLSNISTHLDAKIRK